MKINKKLIHRTTMILSITTFSMLATGCASIVNGTNQPVSVSTHPIKEAKCTLENDKGKWYVSSTPGSTTIHRSYSDLKVKCEKNGYKSGEKRFASKTKPMAFGNIIFGGAIGAGVDVATGSAYDYPTDMQVDLA